MDKIKGFIDGLTGGDGKVDATDLQNAAGDLDLGALGGQLENLGIGGMDLGVLGGLDFPLDKAEIISALKSANVSDQLVSLLDKVPDQVYDSLMDLQKKLPL